MTVDDDIIINEFKNDKFEFIAGACDNEFNEFELQVLYNILTQIIPQKIGDSVQDFQIRVYDHLKHRYDELNWRASQAEIKNRFGYIKKLLEAEIITDDL